MPTPIPHAEVLIGIAEGKTAQFKDVLGRWHEPDTRHNNPIAYPESEWRLKPEPKVVKVRLYSLNGGKRHLVVAVPGTYGSVEEAERVINDADLVWLSHWTDIDITE